MTLSRMVRLVGLLLVAVACLPLYLSDELPGPIWIVVAAGLVLGWFTGAKKRGKEVVVLLTTLLIAGFLLLVFLSMQTGNWLVNSITFALLATVARAMQLSTSRQYFQLVGLSFLLLIASAVTNPDVYFSFFFVLYAVLLTWALTYTHIVQQVEESEEASGLAWKASSFVSRRFLIGSSALALLLLISSMVIFFLFPRLGLGFFSARVRSAESIQGFSDSIELGHFGTLQESGRVVLRLEFVSGEDHIGPESMLRLRGITFDKYDGRGWTKSKSAAYQLRAGRDGFHPISSYGSAKDIEYNEIEYDIYQEPLEIETRVLFSIVRPLSLRPVANRFDRFRGTMKTYFIDEMQDLSYDGPRGTSVSYTMRSGLLKLRPGSLRRTLQKYPRSIRKRYLQLPEGFDPRVNELAEEVIGSADNPYDMALAIESHLANNYKYNKEGQGELTDPISNFLFERKEGHCEYYASAMVLMLRTLGVPARPANGFLGATYNAFGEYYTVTEGRAHSWVEVYFNQWGWITFDPTPAVESLPEETGFFGNIALWFDAMKLEWYKWVVEYDLERQLALYTGLWNAIAPESRQIDLGPESSVFQMRKKMKDAARDMFTWKLGIAALILFTAVMVLPGLIRRYLRRNRVSRKRLDRLAAKLRKLLGRKGFRVLPGATLPALVRQGVEERYSAMPQLARLVVTLEEARWRPDADADLGGMRRLLAEVASAPALKR